MGANTTTAAAAGSGPSQGGAISQKNSRQVIVLHEAADFSGMDQHIFYNLGSYLGSYLNLLFDS